jgi:hypothetical protein
MSSPDSQQIAAKSDSPGLTLPAIFILVALFLVRGFILAAIMPPFEGWDEYQHVGYIDRCAESAQPVIYQQSNLDAAFLHAVAVFPRPEAAPLAAYGAATYAQFWTTGRLPAHDGHTPIELYEAQQPPLYYRLMASVYRLCGGRSDLPLAVSVLRLINVCFGAIAVALVLGWIRKDVPGSTALVMACWVAFHPLLLLNVMRVANDALAFLLGTAVVVILLSSHKRHFARQSILLAFLLPLAVLAKSTNLTLLPVAAAAIVIDVVRCQIKPLHALAASILILALGCAMTWSSFSFNLHHFGVLTSMQETIINHQANKHLLEVLTAMPIQSWAKTTGAMWVSQGLWTGGWSFLRMPLIAMIIYGTIIFLSACLLVAAILFRRGRSRLPIDPSRLTLMLLLLICVECGLMYHAAESYSACGFDKPLVRRHGDSLVDDCPLRRRFHHPSPLGSPRPSLVDAHPLFHRGTLWLARKNDPLLLRHTVRRRIPPPIGNIAPRRHGNGWRIHRRRDRRGISDRPDRNSRPLEGLINPPSLGIAAARNPNRLPSSREPPPLSR